MIAHGDLEKLAQTMLSLKDRPNLHLLLVELPKEEKKAPQQFRFVFGFVESSQLRNALTSVLKLQAKSFLGFSQAMVAPAVMIKIPGNNPEAPKALDVNLLRTSVQDFLQKDPGLKKLGLALTDSSLNAPKNAFAAQTKWLLLKAIEKPRPVEYSWRVSMVFEKTKNQYPGPGVDEVWRLWCAVEIGRKDPGQSVTEVIQDTDTVSQFGKWLNATIDKPLPARMAASRTSMTLDTGRFKILDRPIPGLSGAEFFGKADGNVASTLAESPLTAIALKVFEGTQSLILQQTQWTLVNPPMLRKK
jgi:hypothetical protein